MNTNEIYKDDEIDLFELFKTLWAYKIKILIITFCFVVIGVAYSFLATPWYKATALVEIGYYKKDIEDVVLDKTPDVIEKLKLIYIDLQKATPDKEEIVENISEIKNKPKFFKIETYGKTNEKATNLIKNMVEYISKEHQNILNGYISRQKVAIANLNRKIHHLQKITIADKKGSISYIENITIPRLERQINFFEKSTIPSAKRNIEKIDNIVLPTINSRIKSINNDIKEYEKSLTELKSNSINITKDSKILLSTEIVNLYSQIAASKAHLISLEEQKNTLITTTKPNLEDRLDRLINIDLVKLQEDKDLIVESKLKVLKRDLEELETTELNKLLDQRELLKISLEEHNYKNTGIFSDIITSKNPEKPKKILIVAVSFILGFMISVFGVLTYDSIKKYKIKNI